MNTASKPESSAREEVRSKDEATDQTIGGQGSGTHPNRQPNSTDRAQATLFVADNRTSGAAPRGELPRPSDPK